MGEFLPRHGSLQLQQGDVEGHLAAHLVFQHLLEPEVGQADVLPGLHLLPFDKVISVRHQAVSGDVVRPDPHQHQTDLISPVVDERSRTAGAGPGGGAPQVDEGRPGHVSLR